MRASLLFPALLASGCLFDSSGVIGEPTDGFAKRKPIVIHHDPGADLTGFPVAVVLRGDADLAAVHPSSTDSILFTAADGATPLPFEVEARSARDGDLTAWVRVPILESGQETVLYLYYDRARGASAEDPDSVWEGFAGVWHLSDGSTSIHDSSRHRHTGIPGSAAPRAAEGIAGGALFHDGLTRQHVRIVDHPALDLDQSRSFSVSLWVNPDLLLGEADSPLSKGGAHAGDAGYAVALGYGTWRFHLSGGGSLRAAEFGDASEFDGWVHLAAVVDRSGGVLRAYANGAFTGEADITGMLSSANDVDMLIGNDERVYHGLIDEVQVFDGALPGEWFAASYANLARPAQFLTVGPAQELR